MFPPRISSETHNESGTRLLIIDDDEKLCRLLREYFMSFGYSVDTARDGLEGLNRAVNTAYGAIILDIMLPGMNGIDVLRELRRRSLVPVLMLTARADEADRIAGLEVGADDYLPKTFSTRELLARLRAVLRRTWFSAEASGEFDASPISFGGLWLEPASRQAVLDGHSLALTPIEYEILVALARARGRVKTRESLLVEVADRDFESFDRSIDVHISSLRKKLGEEARTPRFIETVRGCGYRIRLTRSAVQQGQ